MEVERVLGPRRGGFVRDGSGDHVAGREGGTGAGLVIEDGRAIGRMYEDRHAKAELRWFWSITVYVDPKHGIVTSGRGPALEEAKAKFLTSWQNATSASTRQVP